MAESPVVRLQRGFGRILDEARGQSRRPVTDYQRETARETGVALDLMSEAAGAGSAMTDEQRIFLAQSAAGMRARETVLLGIPNRSVAEESELQMIRREMARIEGRPVLEPRQEAPGRIRALLGPIAASPVLAILAHPVTWIVLGLGLIGVQTARLNNAKADLAEARDQVEQIEGERDAWKDRAEAYGQAVADARELARQTADALEAERARAARAAALERRRQRDVQSVLTGSPEPPAWSLRDDETIPPGPAAGN